MQTDKSENKSAQAPRGLGSEAEKREDKKREKANKAAKQRRQAASGSPKRPSRSHVLRPFYAHQCRLSQFFRVSGCFFSFFPFFLFFGFRPRRGWWGGAGGGCGFWRCLMVSSRCLLGSRSLVAAGGLGGVPLAAPWWRALVGSALAAGACRWRLRSSSRSFAGAVVVAGFSSPAVAAAFASAWGWWCGCALAVRRFAGRSGPVWGVSVPVCAPLGSRSLASPPPAWVARG